jgi:hypothetical protein
VQGRVELLLVESFIAIRACAIVFVCLIYIFKICISLYMILLLLFRSALL